MKSRFQIAKLLQEHWGLLNWKGDDHTNGIYFNQQYGYMVERTYAIRMEHNEPVPSVFYVPSDVSETEEDEVLVSYPFEKMVKKPNKFQLLFKDSVLPEETLDELFVMDEAEVELPIQPLLSLLGTISKKRDRDRSWLVIELKGGEAKATLLYKNSQKEITLTGIMSEERMNNVVYIVNANNMFHTLNLFSFSETLFFMTTRDKIKINTGKSKPKMESIISCPKETIQKEILRFRKE